MTEFYYDLHIHSCLSPCGDTYNTPCNIAGIAALSQLDIAALTDHNTCANCPAFFKAAEHYGVIPIAGMELTTAEDIHIICLFPTLEGAMEYSAYIDTRRVKIKNRTDIFGEQPILNEHDEIIGQDEFLLSNATTVTVDEVKGLAKSFGGVAIPAHIDRSSNSIISVLGTLPDTPDFDCVEFYGSEKIEEYKSRYPIGDKKIIIDSDAHYLHSMRERENRIVLPADREKPQQVTEKLFEYLRGRL